MRGREVVAGGDSSVTVTLAEIARIVGMRRAAVTNWRRRHQSFPAAVGGGDSSPLFDLDEIEHWLRDNGKLEGLDPRELRWPKVEAWGEREGAGRVIAAAGARATGLPWDQGLSPGQQELAAELLDEADSVADFEFFLHRWQQANARQVASTPGWLAGLMAELADTMGNRCDGPRTVFDPACGSGEFLVAALGRWGGSDVGLTVRGQDRDPVLGALAAARVALRQAEPDTTAVAVGDALLADAHADLRADVVLCYPPSNERSWGHEELATDPRWTYGLPPRTESELAWVQHVLAHMAPGGTAVLLLPPAVAARRAGRKIRAALLRAGVLHAVAALPVGAAPPYSLYLHLWILRTSDAGQPGADKVVFVDASGINEDNSAVDRASLSRYVIDGVGGGGGVAVPVVDLLDDNVDLTPAKHVPTQAEIAVVDRTAPAWSSLGVVLHRLTELWDELSSLAIDDELGADRATTTVGDLQRAGALTLVPGQILPDDLARMRAPEPGAVPVLLVPDFVAGRGPTTWLRAEDARTALRAGRIVSTRPGDVVVSAVSRGFSVLVAGNEPFALGPQVFALRPDTAVIDPWFVAGCLRAPSNMRQAGTHSSASSRVDIRRLRLLNRPLDEQHRSGELARLLVDFEQLLRDVKDRGRELTQGLGEALLAGTLPEF